MAHTFVAERSVVQDTATATSHPFVPTGTVAAGNLAVLIFGAAGATTLGASDDAGNTWAIGKSQANGTSQTVAIAWSLLANNITTGNTVTATTSSAQSVGGALWEFSGSAASPADQTAGTSGSGNSLSGGTTATLTQADELVIAAFAWNQASGSTVTVTPGTGYSQASASESWLGAATFQRRVTAEYMNVNATTAVTPDLAETTSGTASPAWCGATVTFMAAAVAAPDSNRLRRWLR